MTGRTRVGRRGLTWLIVVWLASLRPILVAAIPAPKAQPWPGGVVVYRFAKQVPDRFRSLIRTAMDDWAVSGFVVFVEAADTPLFRLAWYAGLDRSLFIRYNEALKQFGQASLGAGRWRFLDFNPVFDDHRWWRASFVHELGHVLGLLHEHQRSDRDDYILIPEDFLASAAGRAVDYAVYDDWPESAADLVYDYDSIMHYNSNIDGNRLVRLDSGNWILAVEGPSNGDFERLGRLYAETLFEREAILRGLH